MALDLRFIVLRSCAGLLLLTGCSLVVDANRVQCSTDSDCKHRGPAFANSVCVASLCQARHTEPPLPDASMSGERDAATDAAADAAPDAGGPNWSCLGEPPLPATGPGPFHVSFHLSYILDPSAPVGVSAVLCKKLDVTCSSPQAGPFLSDMQGNVSFDVPAAFTGYVSFTRSDITPGLYFFNPAVNSDLDAIALQVITPDLVTALTTTVGSPQQSSNGIMLLSVYDCNGKAAPGVSFVAQGPGATPVSFYSIGGLPQAMAAGTDSAGYGGFVNVSPGTWGVKGVVAGASHDLPTDSIVLRAGTITYSRLVPQ